MNDSVNEKFYSGKVLNIKTLSGWGKLDELDVFQKCASLNSVLLALKNISFKK